MKLCNLNQHATPKNGQLASATLLVTRHLKTSLLILLMLSLMNCICKAETTPKPKPDSPSITKKPQDDGKKQQSESPKVRDTTTLHKNAIVTDSLNRDLSKTYQGAYKTGNWFIYVIGIFLCLSVIYIIIASPKDSHFPLGLPDGSIRGIIALLAIILYVLLSLTLSAIPPQSAIASDVTKTLGTLVVAISAFYFGSKTAEQGSKTATDNLSKIIDSNNAQNSCDNGIIPLSIIQQAIAANKENWMKIYGCTNVTLGKKVTQDTTHNVDCIVFWVNDKVDLSNPSVINQLKPIPPIVVFATNGKSYNIPTDVQKNQS